MLNPSKEQRAAKLAKFIDLEGFTSAEELFGAIIGDSVYPATCCNPADAECDYTAEMEPGRDCGWCEMSDRSAPVSGLVLGGIIL